MGEKRFVNITDYLTGKWLFLFDEIIYNCDNSYREAGNYNEEEDIYGKKKYVWKLDRKDRSM